MMRPGFRHALALVILLLLAVGLAMAQWRSRSSYEMYEGIRTAREIPSDEGEAPQWTNDFEFAKDVFTFARIRYHAQPGSYGRSRGPGMWHIDCPDSDLNFSFRLQQLTAIRADPDGRIIELTDPELFDYPWIYIVEPGLLQFAEEELPILKRYLLNGGFLMVDDFWGDAEWRNFYTEIKRVFPDRELEELEMSHPIFHCVFPIKLDKQQMQIPNYMDGERSQYNGGITWESEWQHGPGTHDVHFKAIFDDKRRMMVFIAHNTDNGDGWEREGEYKYFFSEFSEKKAYPLGINVVFYAMTH